jgi:hypothetical protein
MLLLREKMNEKILKSTVVEDDDVKNEFEALRARRLAVQIASDASDAASHFAASAVFVLQPLLNKCIPRESKVLAANSDVLAEKAKQALSKTWTNRSCHFIPSRRPTGSLHTNCSSDSNALHLQELAHLFSTAPRPPAEAMRDGQRFPWPRNQTKGKGARQLQLHSHPPARMKSLGRKLVSKSLQVQIVRATHLPKTDTRRRNFRKVAVEGDPFVRTEVHTHTHTHTHSHTHTHARTLVKRS